MKNYARVRNAKVEGSIPFRSTNYTNDLRPILETSRAPNVRRFRPRGTPYRYLRGWSERRRSTFQPLSTIGYWGRYCILLVRFHGRRELRYVPRVWLSISAPSNSCSTTTTP